jgi:hypothetical protein
MHDAEGTQEMLAVWIAVLLFFHLQTGPVNSMHFLAVQHCSLELFEFILQYSVIKHFCDLRDISSF